MLRAATACENIDATPDLLALAWRTIVSGKRTATHEDGIIAMWDRGEHLTPPGLVSRFQKKFCLFKDVQNPAVPSFVIAKNGAGDFSPRPSVLSSSFLASRGPARRATGEMSQFFNPSDLGSDRFLGDCLSSKAIISRPEAGMPTLPPRTISLALSARP